MVVSSPRRLAFALVVALFVTIVLAYLPSLGGGFTNLDDPWLLEKNVLLHRASLRDLRDIWFDFSHEQRLTLGAEYLPVRDTSHWLESRLLGLGAFPIRCVSLLIYLGSGLLLLQAFERACATYRMALILVAVFLLHPVHAESVAWPSGRKDVLGLLFIAASFRAYASASSRIRCSIAAWLTLACLSKSMSVVAVVLLPLLDVLGRRRPDVRALGLGGLAVLALVPLHMWVGHQVGMMSELPGGSRCSAVMTMGPVWLRYVGALLWPPSLSLVHDVPTRVSWDMASLLGYATLFGWACLGLWAGVRRGRWVPLVTFGLFIVPLLPVSQFLYPLQNRMADRYLWLSVLSPACAAAVLFSRASTWGTAVVVGMCVWLAAATAERATIFGDSVLLFADATRKTHTSAVAPYQLGRAYEAAGDWERARAAYQTTLARDPRSEAGRRATNNLARLEGLRHRWDLAEQVLREGLRHFPTDSKMKSNLERTLLHRRSEAGPTPAPSREEIR